jgi:ribonuclease HI
LLYFRHDNGVKAEGVAGSDIPVGFPALETPNEKSLKEVQVFTDGACLGNPGPGGYGVILRYKDHRRELSGGFRLTTNNRMELMGVIKGLEALKEPCRITLHSDSEYVIKALREGWAARWRANGWRRNKKERALNHDLWERVLDLAHAHEMTFEWVRGHSGHAENERCDALAVAAAKGPSLQEDQNYAATSV